MQNQISYLRTFYIIWSRWYWIAIAISLSIALGFLYLSLATGIYAVHALIKFEEKKTEISELVNIRNNYDRNNKTSSEQLVIRSKHILSAAVAQLNYNISFYKSHWFKQVELYPFQALSISIIDRSSESRNPTLFRFNYLDAKHYNLSYTYNDQDYQVNHAYGELLNLAGLRFSIDAFTPGADSLVYFRFSSKNELLNRIDAALKITEHPNTNLLTLYMLDENPEFATDALNAVLHVYLKFDKIQRTTALSQTKKFIDTLLQGMSAAVNSSGSQVAAFKTTPEFIRTSENTMHAYEKLEVLKQQQHQLTKTNDGLILTIKSLGTDSSSQLLKQEADNQLNPLINQFNELRLRKTDALNFHTSNSPLILRINKQLNALHENIIQKIRQIDEENKTSQQYIHQQIQQISAELMAKPSTEKILQGLEAQFQVDQKIYSYLSEKKLETQISNAAVVPAATVIDWARYPSKPIYPVAKQVYSIAVCIGCIGGCGLIYLFRRLNPYIQHEENVKVLSQIPIIGRIKKLDFNPPGTIPMLANPGSVFSESIRAVRSNLSFMAPSEPHKIICITSETSGEGKSFLALNLSAALSLLGKEVLIIAADLRKPDLQERLSISSDLGLSNYLSGQSSWEEVLQPTRFAKIDCILSGPIPPNPAELLYTDKMSQLMRTVKVIYDYVIIDTAPLGLVTDGMPILQMTDITLFVIRSGVSRQEAVLNPERLKKELDLSHVAFVLNAFKNDKLYSNYYPNPIAQDRYPSYFNN